jgi:hypothetical protein
MAKKKVDTTEVDKILERYSAAKSRKSRSDSIRQEAGQYVWPEAQDQVRTSQTNEGALKTVTLYDSTAQMSSYRMTSGIFTYLMPVGSRWFEFVAQDYDLNQDPEYQKWMSIATAQTHKEIWRSNFQREMFITIRSMIVFGTGVISVEKIESDIVFKSHHIGYMCFDDNNRGEIDTAYRQIFYNVRQAVQEFGEAALMSCKSIAKAIKAKKFTEKFEFVHVCGPNEDFDGTRGSHKVRSLYICVPDKTIVKRGGFKHLPYLVARFARAPGEIMGRGPAIEMLPEIKMLNRMKRSFILSSELQGNPPLVVEDDGVVGQPVTGPGGMIYMRSGAMEPHALQTGINTQLNAEVIREQRDMVREAFFNDLFQALAQHRNMTATEVVERVEEKIAILAPAIVSLQKEIFSPLIIRVLDLLMSSTKDNFIPEPPESFDYDIAYQGRLALAMSNMQTNAIEATLAKWMPYAETTPVFENVDFDTSFRMSWLNAGAPAEGLRDIEEMNTEREQNKQLQMAAAGAEIGESASKAYRNVLTAPEEGSLAEAL